MTTTTTAPAFTCTCGRKVMETAPGNAYDHCDYCGTRPSPELNVTIGYHEGHSYRGNDERCWLCDGRPHSHRLYPGDWGYDAVLALADKRWSEGQLKAAYTHKHCDYCGTFHDK